jgi:hypothetical protein
MISKPVVDICVTKGEIPLRARKNLRSRESWMLMDTLLGLGDFPWIRTGMAAIGTVIERPKAKSTCKRSCTCMTGFRRIRSLKPSPKYIYTCQGTQIHLPSCVLDTK